MSANDPKEFTLEKLKINERLESIEEYIKEGKRINSSISDTLSSMNIRCTNVEFMIHGDMRSPDKYTRDGMNRRLDHLENKEKDAEIIKGSFLKIAIGSITMAVGAFILWIIRLIWGSK